MKKEYRQFTTEESTILFPAIVEPKASMYNPSQDPRFACSFSLSDNDLARLKTIMLEMAKESWGVNDLKNIAICIKPQKIKDKNGEYTARLDKDGKPTFMLSSWSYKKPIAVNLMKEDLKEEDCYTGMVGIGIVNLYTFENLGRKFILAGLLSVIKTKEGEKPATSVTDEIDSILSKYKDNTVATVEEIPF